MYKNFSLKKTGNGDGQIIGYHWQRQSPQYVVCIVHGIGEHAGRYDRVAAKMNEAGFAVLSMDLRGHGRSFGKRGHCAPREQVLGDINDLLRQAQTFYPEVQIVLYGHSMGGNIVMDYRKRGGLNELPAAYIVSAPWIKLVKPVPWPVYGAVKVLSKIVPSFPILSGVSSKDLGNEESVGAYEKDPLVHGKITALCAVEGFDTGKALADGSLADNGRASDIPLLLMHGTCDKVCSIKGSDRIAAMENCDYIRWPGLYHEIHNGGEESNGDEVIAKVIRWIQELSE